MGDVGQFSSLGLNAAGGVWITYFDDSDDDLEFAFRAPGGSWTKETVVSAGSVGWQGSLAVEPGGGAHVAYHDSTASTLMYVFRPAGASAWTVPETVPVSGDFPSLGLDANGGVHICYHNRSVDQLEYILRMTAGGWTSAEPIAGAVGTTYPARSSLAVDAAGVVHVGYYNGELKYANRAPGGAWPPIPVAVDSHAFAGDYPSLAVDSAGGVHISYFAETPSALMYAYRSPAGTWTQETADEDGGQYTSLAVDAAGGVHISYYDVGNTNLKYAYRPSGGSFTSRTVDASLAVGQHTSLALDATAGVHISYYDVTNRDLKYAYRPPCP